MLINESELFNGVSASLKDAIAKITVKESCGKGTMLFKTGDPAKHFYVLQEGRISVCADQKNHEVSFIHRPGESFGWSSLVGRNSYSASAECIVPTTVSKIEKDALIGLLNKDPASGIVFYRNFATIVGRRFIETSSAQDWFPTVES